MPQGVGVRVPPSPPKKSRDNRKVKEVGEDDISSKHHVEVVGEIATYTGKSGYQDNSLFAPFEDWGNHTPSVCLGLLIASKHSICNR